MVNDCAELLNILVLANEFKEGDLLVGGNTDEQLRAEARQTLSLLSIKTIDRIRIVDDQLSEQLIRHQPQELRSHLATLTIGQLKNILLDNNVEGMRQWLGQFHSGLSSEVIAAVVKLMSNDQLAYLASQLFNPLSTADGRNNIGARNYFGSRIQPNSPSDDEEEILFSILEGLSFGCGDVILGINPASDDLDTIVRLEALLAEVVKRLQLPTRYCVLSDIIKQTSARAHGPIDVGFQSLAGTSKSLIGMVGLDVDGLIDQCCGFKGLYFETGQGSAVTNGLAEGVDMVTLESRAYGLARLLRQQAGNPWMIVNDVAGFIGPEVFRAPEQLLRACLEDIVMAKLHGITMGLDICSTFHMGIEPTRLHRLTEEIVMAAKPAYLMAVAGNADPMLGYLTTSFRQHPQLRKQTNRKITDVMAQALNRLGITIDAGVKGSATTVDLYVAYQQSGNDRRSRGEIEQEGTRRLNRLRDRGFDLGYGAMDDLSAPIEIEQRLAKIYQNGRTALYAELNTAQIARLWPDYQPVRTTSIDRDNYLAHPASGEMISASDIARIGALYAVKRPAIQLVISDGLNANAINENIGLLLPPLRAELARLNYQLGEWLIVVTNGRVRAGYHIGEILNVELIVHLIGERPGTGIDTMSAYLTYGRDRLNSSQWQRQMEHSLTTAICGINRRGRAPEQAVPEIANYVEQIFQQRCSGVNLRKS